VKTTDKPQFGEYRCRSDAQRWTVGDETPHNQLSAPRYLGVLVNGQIRMLAEISAGISVEELETRASEMAVCQLEDVEFQNKFNTYAMIERQYQSEVTYRYRMFLLNHGLLEQFKKEDAQGIK
jgi:hypothetical protein